MSNYIRELTFNGPVNDIPHNLEQSITTEKFHHTREVLGEGRRRMKEGGSNCFALLSNSSPLFHHLGLFRLGEVNEVTITAGHTLFVQLKHT